MQSVTAETVTSFVDACHQVAQRGLVRCSSGNLSLRVADDRLLVTATRSWLERITPQDLALCRVSDGLALDGPKPTVEIGLHAGVLRARPDVNVVLHFQSPCATALACRSPGPLDFFVIPEIPFYIGPIGRVTCLAPGSAELATAVVEAVRSHDLVMLANHGQVVVARDFDHAIQNAVFFELACEIILRNGDLTTALSVQAAQALLDARKAVQAAKV